MPLAHFPGERNWGYDGVLPYAPQASYAPWGQVSRVRDGIYRDLPWII